MEDMMNRKTFLMKGFLKVAEPIVEMIADRVKEVTKRRVLRPPGAIEEVAFLAECTRCDECIKACHQGAVRRATELDSLAIGTPIIVPSEVPCYLCDELPCIKACPTKALELVPREKVKIGVAKVKEKLCHKWGGKDVFCDYCFDRCPFKGKAILFDMGGPQVDEKRCTGCGICEYFCPADPKAIVVMPI
ncbi:MAG: 4Fe-4S dicluster domain-containing protein [Deltaproteobacteria bacterium]|nr:4Fe-4S dicluster domain-containing protein [Deltaproteobacteria bacterium]